MEYTDVKGSTISDDQLKQILEGTLFSVMDLETFLGEERERPGMLWGLATSLRAMSDWCPAAKEVA